MRITRRIFAAFAPCLAMFPAHADTPPNSNRAGAAPAGAVPPAGGMVRDETIRKIVDDIALIASLPPKANEGMGDPHARAILALDRRVGPYLVPKIADTSPSGVVAGFRYAVGDIALELLVRIYRPPSRPFPDGSTTIPRPHGDYRDYVAFMRGPGARARVQRSWAQYIGDK